MHTTLSQIPTQTPRSLADRPPAHLPLVRPWIIRGDGLVDQHVEQGANEITPSGEPKRPLLSTIGPFIFGLNFIRSFT